MKNNKKTLYELIFENEEPKKPVWKSVRLEDNEKGHQTFLRIGQNIDSLSRFGLGAEWEKETGKKFESGVSVYFLANRNSGYFISRPNQAQASYGLKNYFENMFTKVLFEPIMLGQIYVVTGKLIAIESPEAEEYFQEHRPNEANDYSGFYDYETGTDGEPLLKTGTVKIIKQVGTIEFFEKFYLNDGYTVKDLFMNRVQDWIDQDLPDETPDELVDYLNAEIQKRKT